MRPSHPVRGAWIEIRDYRLGQADKVGRTPSGVRGLKYIVASGDSEGDAVAPRQGCVD